MTAVGGLLLTGGASTRMGTDKSLLVIDGRTWAARAAAVLVAVCGVAVEVGPGHSDLPAVAESPPGQGPLPAVVAGRAALARLGRVGTVVVLACDLPHVTVDAVQCLASWPGAGSVAPLLDGEPQPLCARWSMAALDAAARRLAAGGRRVSGLLDADDAVLIDERWWAPRFGPRAFADVDTVAELEPDRTQETDP